MTPEELQEKTIVAMKPIATIFLHGTIKRPVSDGGYLGLTIECGWCRSVKVLPNATPEGWVSLNSGATEHPTLYCCPDCVPMAFPELTDG